MISSQELDIVHAVAGALQEMACFCNIFHIETQAFRILMPKKGHVM
jgi:hypothetical protein